MSGKLFDVATDLSAVIDELRESGASDISLDILARAYNNIVKTASFIDRPQFLPVRPWQAKEEEVVKAPGKKSRKRKAEDQDS